MRSISNLPSWWTLSGYLRKGVSPSTWRQTRGECTACIIKSKINKFHPLFKIKCRLKVTKTHIAMNYFNTMKYFRNHLVAKFHTEYAKHHECNHFQHIIAPMMAMILCSPMVGRLSGWRKPRSWLLSWEAESSEPADNPSFRGREGRTDAV